MVFPVKTADPPERSRLVLGGSDKCTPPQASGRRSGVGSARLPTLLGPLRVPDGRMKAHRVEGGGRRRSDPSWVFIASLAVFCVSASFLGLLREPDGRFMARRVKGVKQTPQQPQSHVVKGGGFLPQREPGRRLEWLAKLQPGGDWNRSWILISSSTWNSGYV